MIRVGTDIIEISRIAKSIQNPRFLSRVFSPAEQRYLAYKRNAPETAAGLFAAKEAFAKALGSGIRGFALFEVSVEHDTLGAPVLVLSGAAAALAAGWTFSLSISHCKSCATAVVIAYKQ